MYSSPETSAIPQTNKNFFARVHNRQLTTVPVVERKTYSCKGYQETDYCLSGRYCDGLVIKKPGNYYLSDNTRIKSKEAAILILASNVTLDLCGFRLSSSSTPIGIMIGDGAKDITVKKGTLSGFLKHGFFLDGLYKNITLQELVFDNIRTDLFGNTITDVSETSVILKGKRDFLIKDCVIRNCGKTTTDGVTHAILLQDIGGLFIDDLQIYDCEFTRVISARRSSFEFNNVRIYANRIMYDAINELGSSGKCNKISIFRNTFIALQYKDFGSSLDCICLTDGSLTNCSIVDNVIEKEAFRSIVISSFQTGVDVENVLVSRNKSSATIYGFVVISADASIKISNSEFANNTTKDITALAHTTFINSDELGPTNSSVIVTNLRSSQNKATDKYSFLSVFLFDDDPIKEELSIQLEGCASSNNQGAGVSFNLQKMTNCLIRDCLSQKEQTGFLVQEGDNVLERNVAQRCVTGFVNQGNSTFITNQVLFCLTPYQGVTNTLSYTDPAVTVTTNIFN